MTSSRRILAWLAAGIVVLTALAGGWLVYAASGVGLTEVVATILVAVVGAAGVVANRWSLRQAEAASRRCLDILDAVSDGYIALDKEDRIVLVSPKIARLLGVRTR